jgi:N-acetyl-gamma-glutamyl-phosphate reductase
MLEIGIIGGSGFVAGELIRCLLNHPKAQIKYVFSHSNSGKNIGEIHQDLIQYTNWKFTDKVNLEVDLVFLCLGHGNSKKFLKEHEFSNKTKIIDLSNDFRLEKDSHYQNRNFTYGLVELNKNEISQSQNIANPGCFATAIQLAILPFIQYSSVLKTLHINAITGSTGAGKSLSKTSAHSWRNNNISVYKAFNHQHLAEIKESISLYRIASNLEINFIPYRGDFTRGIFASIYTESDYCEKELIALYKDYYQDAKFTHVVTNDLSLKPVINTNNCLIQVQKIGTKVFVNAAMDNLLKGAAGQAIQNMNLMFGFDETLGLNLKSSYF